jgi:hypothetical protein
MGPGEARGVGIWPSHVKLFPWQGSRGRVPSGAGISWSHVELGPRPEGRGARPSEAGAPQVCGVGTCQACYSFSRWWCGKAVHNLGVQSAEPCAVPQLGGSPASQQGP